MQYEFERQPKHLEADEEGEGHMRRDTTTGSRETETDAHDDNSAEEERQTVERQPEHLSACDQNGPTSDPDHEDRGGNRGRAAGVEITRAICVMDREQNRGEDEHHEENERGDGAGAGGGELHGIERIKLICSRPVV